MVITHQKAPSNDRAITKTDVLKSIIRKKINNGNYLFYRPHLGREYVLGTVGDRGGGKSGSDAVISIVDFMIRDKPVWSNMEIKFDVNVDDEQAKRAGLNSGGIVQYRSLPIEKDKLLQLDETYRKGCLVIEEINVQFSNVRRFMSNTNIEANELYQQLRKFETSLIYNVIDEMFVDPQLRALTDIWIRTYDTAFDMDSLARFKKPGIDFCWRVYSYSGYLNGEQGKYEKTKQSYKSFFKFAPWHGVYDTMQHQEKGIYSLNKRERAAAEKAQLSVESSGEMEAGLNQWQWLIDNVRKLKNSGVEYLEAHQLWQVLEVVENGYTPAVIGKLLPQFGITRHHYNKFGKWVHKIESFSIEDEASKQASVAVRN